MRKTAVLIPPYRYVLTREWNDNLPRLAIIMLNPSTADADRDDPTIRKCMWFAGAWHYGSIEVVNFCAYRATNPADLLQAARRGMNIIGPKNFHYIREAVTDRDCLVACGQKIAHLDYSDVQTIKIILESAKKLLCLQVSKDGWPLHPLYISKNTQPREFIWR